jgi:hypothetical protein
MGGQLGFRSALTLQQLDQRRQAPAHGAEFSEQADQTLAADGGPFRFSSFALPSGRSAGAGPKREIYLDPMLEIQFPMKSAALKYLKPLQPSQPVQRRRSDSPLKPSSTYRR